MENIIQIAFPGLGIEPFEINRVAFSVFGLEVRWYGVVITLGIVLAYLYAAWRGKQYKINTDDLMDIAMFTVIFGIIGARLYYVVLQPDEFNSLMEVINIRTGGLAIYGGVIFGALTIAIGAKIKKINLLCMLDCAAPGVMIAQSLGRWGNFFNGEAYGAETEIFCRMGLRHHNWSKMYFFHPTFLYESLWNLLGFVIINLLYRKKKFHGQIALMYFAWYGFGRMFIEGLREDSLTVGDIRVSQVVAAVTCAVSLILIVIGLVLTKRRKAAEENYNPVYASAPGTAQEETTAPDASEPQTAIIEEKEEEKKNDGTID